MKNVTKTNILFTFMVLFYIILILVVRFIPLNLLNVNVRLVLPELIMLVPAFIYISVLKPEGLGNISFKSPGFSNIGRILLFTFCIMPAISLINAVSTIFVENHAAATMEVVISNPLWVNVLLIGIVPGICEEYLFRGLIFNGYSKKNPVRAMLMSSLLFGLIHMNVNQFLYAFVMGMVLCLLVYATKTVASSMIAHCFFNSYNVIMAYSAMEILEEAEEILKEAEKVAETQAVTPNIADYIITYGTMIGIAYLFLLGARKLFKKICADTVGYENVKKIFTKKSLNEVDESQGRFFDPYIIIGIAICIIYIIIYGL